MMAPMPRVVRFTRPQGPLEAVVRQGLGLEISDLLPSKQVHGFGGLMGSLFIAPA